MTLKIQKNEKCILHLCTFQTPSKSAEMSAKAKLPRALQMRKGVIYTQKASHKKFISV